MNKNFEAWVGALEGGDYSQCIEQLKRVNTFCVMGVGCDLYAKAHPEEAWWRGDTFVLKDNRFHMVATMPEAVLRWMGIRSVDVELNGESGAYGRQSLMMLNDRGWSFKALAEVMRKNYLEER